MEDPSKQLVALLEKYKVPSACIKYMTASPDHATDKGIGFESISDFASAFTESDYATGVKDMIAEQVESSKGNIMAVARLRTAWQMASAELTKAKKRKIEGGPETDWDTPLEDEVEAQRKVDFEASYGELRFDTESVPGANLLGRWFREFRSPQRQISLISLHKMRSEADYKQLGTVKRQEIVKGLSLVSDGTPNLPDVYFDSTMRLLEAVRLMTNGWAMTGYTQVESKLYFDNGASTWKKVMNCHLSQAISYYDFVFRKAMEFHGDEATKVHWLLERDRQTRAKAKNLYAQG